MLIWLICVWGRLLHSLIHAGAIILVDDNISHDICRVLATAEGYLQHAWLHWSAVLSLASKPGLRTVGVQGHV